MLGERHDRHFFPLIGRQQDGVALRMLFFQTLHRGDPLGPRARRFRNQIAAVEHHARVDVPRHAVHNAVDFVRGPDAGEVILLMNRRALQPRPEILERANGMELRDPGVAHLRDVGSGLTNVRGQQLFVRRGPRNLLHLDADAGPPGELRHQRGHHLALAAQAPELQLFLLCGASRTGENDKKQECRTQNEEFRI